MGNYSIAASEYAGLRGRADRRARERARKKRKSAGALIVLITCCIFAGTLGIPKIITFTHAPGTTPVFDSITRKAGIIEREGRRKSAAENDLRMAPGLQVSSANAVLVDLKSGDVLFEKNSEAKIYPASLTKIMTAVLAIESITDLKEKIALSEPMFSPIYTANAATAGFSPGDSVSANDLLYGLLLTSGVECAAGLAEYVAGSESEFAEMMNDKARQIGMKNTHFSNATGLHDENHYSTAMDMAALFTYALNNDIFFEIITSATYTTAPANRTPEGIRLDSTLFSKMENTEFSGGKLLGGKTGFTDEAGQCLASFAIKDDRLFVLVTAGAPGENGIENLHIDDALRVYSAIAPPE